MKAFLAAWTMLGATAMAAPETAFFDSKRQPARRSALSDDAPAAT